MEGTDASLFSFNSATRQITLQAALDFEAKPSLSVRVKADDGRGGTDTVAVTIDLTDVSEPPLRPGKPTAVAVSATSLKVSWAAPDSTGRPTITGYDVRWRDNLGSLDWIDAPRVTGTSATITGLKANMEYVLQVRSVNPDGESDWSSPGHGDTGDHGRGGTDPGEGGGTDPGEGGGSGGSGGGGDSAAVRIFHAEPVAEGEPLRFRVGLDAPARRRLDLLASTAGQTAADGADYLGFSRRPVMVAPGASEVWLEVPTARDADDGEGDEKLTVTLAVAPGSAPASVVRSEAQGTILDGPPPEAVVPLFLADAEARHGFVRVLDRGWRGGPVTVAATDDGGAAADSMLRLPTQGAAHFNSSDLELGNTVKGLAPGTGMPTRGDWRLRLTGADAAALAYARTRDGFVTPLAGTVPAADGGLFVAFFNPGSNFRQVSLLRLHNPGEEDARITVEGTDDSGASPGTPVRLTVPGGESVTLSARELEGGAAPGIDLDGALGDGRGKWRLSVTSDRPVEAMSLLESPTGHLANLSAGTAPRTEGDGGTARTLVPLFPSASDPDRRQGFIRVVNRGSGAAEVRIEARDDAGTEYPAVTLALDAEEAVHLNSQDLENGAASKGLTAGAGPGEGHWRLEATAPSEVVVLAYLRHLDDGFLTGMNAMAPLVDDNVHQVDFLNPGSNHRQASLLRLVNPGAEPAQVAVSGTDDAGEPGAAEVRLALPANTVRMLTSAELEDGGERLEGALGDGTGKWRLRVVSDRPIQVMSLLASPTGHLANLSVGFGDGAADQPGMQDNRP
ncbi:MAG: hypothetical protein F4149_05325 [Gammaproteobacteria bacterium]|nr:hypothetical protein [Gammaproteobacteria bacterium]